MEKKVAIIGAGPGGIAAAIQLKRYNLEPLVFEKDIVGGLLQNAWQVENYPGFDKGISGPELCQIFGKQLKKFGVKIRNEKIELLDYYDSVKRFDLRTIEKSFSPEFVIVASGTKPKKIDLFEKASKKCRDKLFYEVFPLLNLKNKRIGIIGAGDAAFDYAMNLAANNEVVILNRTDKITALPRLREFEKNEEKITYCENIRILLMNNSSKNRLAVTLAKFDETWLLEVDYLLAAVGREPQKDFYSEQLLANESRLLGNGLLYNVGDIKNSIYRQTAIAVGDGIRAAMEIYNRIKDEDR